MPDCPFSYLAVFTVMSIFWPGSFSNLGSLFYCNFFHRYASYASSVTNDVRKIQQSNFCADWD